MSSPPKTETGPQVVPVPYSPEYYYIQAPQGNGGGIPEAPIDDFLYGRENAGWQRVPPQIPGPQGDPGPIGPSGPAGQDGQIGPTGNPGPQGPSGGPGVQGPPGPQGPIGNTGPTGKIGPIGPQGPIGAPLVLKGTVATAADLPTSGNNPGDLYIAEDTLDCYAWDGTLWNNVGPIEGPPGSTGPQGVQGPIGPVGIQGNQGVPGPTGGTGPQGIPGSQGIQGPQGIVGPAGPQGSQGPVGQGFNWKGVWSNTTNYALYDSVSRSGSSYVCIALSVGNDPATDAGVHWGLMAQVGAKGPQGTSGPQGPPGIGINMKGTVATSANLPTSGQQTNDTYTALDTGHAWTWNGTAWIDIGPIQGPVGPTGASGANGTDGAPGAAASVAVGTTTTGAAGTPANVSNSGSSSAAVLNFTIPQGLQGVQGVQGTSGPAGSAGPTGATGPSGIQGPAGTAGPTGAPGVPGMVWRGAWSGATAYVLNDVVSSGGSSYICISGNTNNQPPNATYWQLVAQIGATGVQGPAGATGATGIQGPVGPAGPTGVGMTWRGAWAGAAAYALNDVVSQGGSSYICISANTGNTPPNATYWQIVAQVGAPGPQGPTGPASTVPGPAGSTGPAGSQGPQGVPGVPMVWRGIWSSSTTYAVNDGVSRTNQSYICVVANTGGDPATDTTHWNLLAAQGGPGPTAISADAGNTASLGTDHLVFVPAPKVAQIGGILKYVSTTQLSFLPFKGSGIQINGVVYNIPPTGVVGLASTGIYIDGVAGQNFAVSTNYYVYCFNNAGVLTADFSTTGHATSSTAGNVGTEIKSGDDTRTLIGLIRIISSGGFTDSPTVRFTRSWFNRGRLPFAASGSAASSGGEAATAVTVSLVCFGDDALFASGNAFGTGSVVANYTLFMELDGVSISRSACSTTGTTAKYEPTAVQGAWNPSEGYHVVALYSSMSAGTFSGTGWMSGILG